ncbi:MAG: glycosyltransferase family 2 protein [Clostridia bacterium]|nr:glycosyltransferase family 2 protein [Clostridia bacterium]
MSKAVKISVIVPVYNVQDYLAFALQSLAAQTLKDVEFVCVNDGSTDNSLAILEEFAKKDERFVIVNKKNGGLSSARNAGIKASTGQYIMFLDSDDYYAENACERIWIEFEEAPTDIIIFGSIAIPQTPRPSDWYFWNMTVYSHRYYGFNENLLFGIPSSKPFVWRQAFSRAFLDRIGLTFDEDVKFGEDIIFQFKAFPYADNVSYISDPLYYYRWQRNGSLMSKAVSKYDRLVREHLNITKKILEFFKERDLIKVYDWRIFEWATEFAGKDIACHEFDSRIACAKELIELLNSYDVKLYKGFFSRYHSKIYKKLRKLAKR